MLCSSCTVWFLFTATQLRHEIGRQYNFPLGRTTTKNQFEMGDVRMPLFSDDGEVKADIPDKGNDTLHFIENHAEESLVANIRAHQHLINKPALEAMVKLCHGKPLLSFDNENLLAKCDARSIRELYMLCNLTFMADQCWRHPFSAADRIKRDHCQELIVT